MDAAVGADEASVMDDVEIGEVRAAARDVDRAVRMRREFPVVVHLAEVGEGGVVSLNHGQLDAHCSVPGFGHRKRSCLV